jgi:hypothetical protein
MQMAITPDNPAARLLAILKEGKTKDIKAPSRKIWHELLQVPEGDHVLLMTRLARVMSLPTEIAVEVLENHPDETQTVSHWKGQITNAFLHLNLNSPWESFINAIDHLNITAKLLHHVARIKPADTAALIHARDKIQDLLSEINSSDIDGEIKITVTRYLINLINTIDEYFITGALPILDASNVMLGNLVVDPKYREFIKSNSLGQKVLSTVSLAANAVTIAVSLPQLTQAFTSSLALLSGHGS